MSKILRTTLATAFAAACLAGASVTFAADNNGHNNNGGHKADGVNDHDSDLLKTDPSTTGSVSCDNNAANTQAGCMKDGVDQQQ